MRGKKKGFRIISLLLVFSMLLGLMPVNAVLATETTQSYSRINVQTAENGVYKLAQAMYNTKNVEVDLVYNQTIVSGDVVVKTNGSATKYGNEGYSIKVADGIVTITSATNKGARYGLNDVLQQLEKGTVSDVDITTPFKEVRALFVDCGRKYFSVEWFEETIREMSWNGMNTLYISFSNDEGFRFLLDDMSLSFDDGEGTTVEYDDEFMSHLADNPEQVADSEFLTERNANATDEGNSRVVSNYDTNEYLTQNDMNKILAYAKAYGVNVVPELNSPGHFGQVMWYFPEYRIQGTWYEDGQPHYGLDLTNVEAYNFGQALVKKYIDYFASQGVTAFSVGGDEYSAGNATNAQVAAYTNALATYAEKQGMDVYAWNDGQAAANNLLKDSVTVLAWNGSNNNYSSINFNSNYLYYVLKSYTWKPTAATLYETWTPLTYYGNTIASSDVVDGASLAIWCDEPDNETTADILESMLPNIQAFGYRMWNYSETSTASLSSEYDSYSEFASAVTNAPVISEETVLAAAETVTEEEDVTLPEPSSAEGYELVTFDSTDSTTIEDGTYIIVNGTDKAMTNTTSGAGLAKTQVTIDGTLATPVNSIYEWTFAKQSNGTYYITNADGKYLNISSTGVSVSTTAQNITATFSGGKVQLSNGSYALNYYASSDLIFSWWYTGTSDANNMQTLYKKLATEGLVTLYLYNAIISAQEYNNDDNQYGSSEFETLQTVLSESITLYKNASVEDTTITQEEIDAQTEKLLSAIDALVLSDLTVNYIEIPIEILDFKADGVMFEYAQNTAGKGLYELLTDAKFGNLTYGNTTVAMPGTTGDRKTNDEWNGWNDTCKRTGLVEDYLVNGAPVYKEATVDYVAKLIAKGYFTDLSSSITNWNSNISAKITELYARYSEETDTNSNLGSWAETLAKTSTLANGGDMTWSNVATCYDLAYYILNNMWRSTETADGSDAYNKAVGERTTLRMLAGDGGYYYLDSTKEISYTGNYIFNTDLTTENTAETKFTPINDLGYESSASYGDTTDTTSGVNFHYTLHANGSFVYNADDNLYFYFDGDDDVYFYINGQLVMDLGGAHSHCDDELYLNDIADELGLVDGGIYTFDMFYAERHTTQANLEFRTNIKIMDTMSTTSKGQYNASTGEVIPYGSIVDKDTTVAYSFNLLNLRSVNVTDISFIDGSLGSNLSKDSVTLYDESKTNGATTSITDIIVYYHTYDRPAPSEPGTLNSESVQTKTVAEITAMINAANTDGYDSLDKGSYIVTISNEDQLKSLLELGVPIDTQICVYGVKRNVTEKDRPYINTVTSRAYYTSNGKKIALNGIASQKLTVLNSFSQVADKEQVVIDYGKVIEVNLENIKNNIYENDGVTAEFYGITVNGSHGQIRTNVSNVYTKPSSNETEAGYTAATSNGTYYLKDCTEGTLKFKLNQMLSEVEKVYAVYKITDTSLVDTAYETYYLLVEVDIIPATMMYYETDFAEGIFAFTSSGDTDKWSVQKDNIEADSPQDDGTVGENQTYGYDSSYINDAQLSNGESYYVEGAGRTKTIATFSFTGTGFDLISRTGENQGAIRVDIYSDAAMTTREKSVTVLNKSESKLELYQIPVVSVNTLNYGTHYVKIGVNASYTDESNTALSRGNQFYFDAIRVYDPLDEASSDYETIARYAYAADGEYEPLITEVREILLDSDTYESGVNGVLFVDKTQKGVSLAEYAAIGPNNEVYLTPKNAIVFKVSTEGTVGSIDIGAKSADGNPVELQVTIANAAENATATYVLNKSIETSTSLYYDVVAGNNINNYLNENGEAYIVITNAGNSGSILSITDIKVGYNDKPVATTFLVDDTVIAYAESVLVNPDYDIKSATLSSSSYSILKKVEMTVVTTTDVESLTVTNKYGMKLGTQTTYTVNEDGMKVWTVKFRSLLLGSQTFTVTGYGADGTAGESATVSAKIKLF